MRATARAKVWKLADREEKPEITRSIQAITASKPSIKVYFTSIKSLDAKVLVKHLLGWSARKPLNNERHKVLIVTKCPLS